MLGMLGYQGLHSGGVELAGAGHAGYLHGGARRREVWVEAGARGSK